MFVLCPKSQRYKDENDPVSNVQIYISFCVLCIGAVCLPAPKAYTFNIDSHMSEVFNVPPSVCLHVRRLMQ